MPVFWTASDGRDFTFDANDLECCWPSERTIIEEICKTRALDTKVRAELEQVAQRIESCARSYLPKWVKARDDLFKAGERDPELDAKILTWGDLMVEVDTMMSYLHDCQQRYACGLEPLALDGPFNMLEACEAWKKGKPSLGMQNYLAITKFAMDSLTGEMGDAAAATRPQSQRAASSIPAPSQANVSPAVPAAPTVPAAPSLPTGAAAINKSTAGADQQAAKQKKGGKKAQLYENARQEIIADHLIACGNCVAYADDRLPADPASHFEKCTPCVANKRSSPPCHHKEWLNPSRVKQYATLRQMKSQLEATCIVYGKLAVFGDAKHDKVDAAEYMKLPADVRKRYCSDKFWGYSSSRGAMVAGSTGTALAQQQATDGATKLLKSEMQIVFPIIV